MKLSGKLYNCNTCNKKKSIQDFPIYKGKKHGGSCSLCKRKYSKEYYHTNKEGKRDTENERTLKYYYDNMTKCKDNGRDWRKSNLDKRAASEANRRSNKMNRTPSWLSATEKAKIRSIYKMSRSLSKKTGVEHHVDHIVPLQGELVSGLHVPWNLRVITATDNLSKGNRFDEDMI